MASNRRNTFMSRASLFASPGDSCVPRKKVARDGSKPVFDMENETTVQTSSAELSGVAHPVFHIQNEVDKQPSSAENVVEENREILVQYATAEEEGEDEGDAEPMEVDGTVVPSPQKDPPTPRSRPCTTATTPRRKSMPTPGKRLFFTSKEIEAEEKKTDETTQLELLIANNPQEMSDALKRLIDDKKEMGKYDVQVKREIEEIEGIQKARNLMLKNAREFADTCQVSSLIPCETVTLDLTIRKTEIPADAVRRLHVNFLAKTQEAGLQRAAHKNAVEEEQTNEILNKKLERLEAIRTRNEMLEEEMRYKYEEQNALVEQFGSKIEHIDVLVKSLQPISLAF